MACGGTIQPRGDRAALGDGDPDRRQPRRSGCRWSRLPISPRKLHWYLWHKSIGITIFLLTSLAARLARRFARIPTGADAAVAAASERACRMRLLYVLLFVIPVSGWLYSSATGVQVV